MPSGKEGPLFSQPKGNSYSLYPRYSPDGSNPRDILQDSTLWRMLNTLGWGGGGEGGRVDQRNEKWQLWLVWLAFGKTKHHHHHLVKKY